MEKPVVPISAVNVAVRSDDTVSWLRDLGLHPCAEGGADRDRCRAEVTMTCELE